MESPLNEFVSGIKAIIDGARGNAVRSVDFCRVRMYWAIGQRIAEKEQQGKERAGYGTYLIKNLAKQLQPEYGSGFSVRQLEMCRQFYRIYPIANTLCSQLNWSQYKLLISIPDPDKREYYQLEAVSEISDTQIVKLLRTTKATITAIREKTHKNIHNIHPKNPVTLGLCSESDLNKAIAVSVKRVDK